MIEKAFLTIEKYQMLLPGDKVIVGVSGGADSVALLMILNDLREKMNLTLFVVHVNHGIRKEEGKRDEEFVFQLCQEIGIICESAYYDVPALAKKWSMTEEEAGRKVRYEAFEEALKRHEATKISVAHHLNDQVETILMRLCRGTGLKGLGGIPPKRGHIIRPLIECSRKEIEDWLLKEKIAFCVDSSNFTREYTRNKIRMDVLPYLQEQINEKTVANIAKTAQLLMEEDAFIEEEAAKAFASSVIEKREKTVTVSISMVKTFSPVIQKRVIRQALNWTSQGLKDFSRENTEDVWRLLIGESGKSISLRKGIRAIRDYDCLKISGEKEKPTLNYSYTLKLNEPQYIKEAELYVMISKKMENNKKNKEFYYTKCFDYDKIKDVLIVRNRRPSDSIIINQEGNKKKIKDFFIDEKISRTERNRVPLLVAGNQVLWIIGHRSAGCFEAGEQTGNPLYVQVWEASND